MRRHPLPDLPPLRPGAGAVPQVMSIPVGRRPVTRSAAAAAAAPPPPHGSRNFPDAQHVPPEPAYVPRRLADPQPATGVQAGLDDASFAERCAGFDEVQPQDLLSMRGGTVRYVTERLDPATGEVAGKQYRLGGILISVDPHLRYLRLLNPYARVTWSVQLGATAARRTRLWYQAPSTSSEVTMMRRLLQQLENGEIQIKKTRRP